MRVFKAGWMTVSLIAMVVSGAAVAATPKGVTQASEDARFKAIYSAEWTWREHQKADDEDSGDHISAHLPDVGPAAQAARLRMWSDVTARLKTIHPERLSAASFCLIRAMWCSAVRGEMKIALPISAYVFPCTTRRATSISRSLSPA